MKRLCFLYLLLMAFPAFAAKLPGIPEFIDEMVEKHQFKREELVRLFDLANEKPVIIEAISRPIAAKPWPEYRASFVNRYRIEQGLLFWKKYRKTLARAERTYGVPQEIIVALIGVETLYGRQTGNFRTIDALTTLAFDYPRRADFFRDELENYLLLAREQQLDLLDVKGSYAGALGIPQFMPSSYRKYAVDFNGNRKKNLMGEVPDAIGSVGNYLKNYGWIRGGRIALRANVTDAKSLDDAAHDLDEWVKVGVTPMTAVKSDEASRLLSYTVQDGKEFWLAFNNFDVIMRYNNSDYYAMSVFQLAKALKSARQR